MIRRSLGQPLENQSDLFANAQSFYDDAAEFCQLITSVIDKIIQPIFEFFVQFNSSNQPHMYLWATIASYSSIPLSTFVLAKL